jgi:hypothetical protein
MVGMGRESGVKWGWLCADGTALDEDPLSVGEGFVVVVPMG